ncbi:hypothetical protein Glove_248g3 [Diversispora epigaea]|uniref:BED-type domain-containing protein n=1 Tax=Diversispora epigaea TaxID=1348612 RepID=A0A397IEZ2_9GLOM|nr:hypothetical protein Glove_248g3 [Diversispora epigaea]
MPNESSIDNTIPLIDSIDYIDSGTFLHREQDITIETTSSLIIEHDIAIETTSSIIHEQEIEIESSNSHSKIKVWDYFSKPYGPPKSRKTKCSICKIEFSYHGSTSSLKYHLKNRHKIDMSMNLSQVKRKSQQIPSQQSSENENSLLQSSTITLANKKSKVWDYFAKPYCSSNDKNCKTKCLKCEMEFSYDVSTFLLKYHLINGHNIVMSTNLGHSIDQIQNQNLKQKNADILTDEEWFFTILKKLLKINRNDKDNKDAIMIRGKFYLKMGKYKESIADLNKVLEIEPNNVKVLKNRGKAYKRMGKYNEFMEDSSRAQELNLKM